MLQAVNVRMESYLTKPASNVLIGQNAQVDSLIVFNSLMIVVSTEPDPCTLPRVKGPCLGNIKRYYYNDQTQKCEAFRYGGCIGNKNNFFSLHDCELACSG